MEASAAGHGQTRRLALGAVLVDVKSGSDGSVQALGSSQNLGLGCSRLPCHDMGHDVDDELERRRVGASNVPARGHGRAGLGVIHFRETQGPFRELASEHAQRVAGRLNPNLPFRRG